MFNWLWGSNKNINRARSPAKLAPLRSMSSPRSGLSPLRMSPTIRSPLMSANLNQSTNISENEAEDASALYSTPIKKRLNFLSEEDCSTVTEEVVKKKPRKSISDAIDVNDINFKRYDNKQDCKNALFYKYGQQKGRTLKPSSHGSGYFTYRCANKDCDFKMVITNKSNTWGLNRDSSVLIHQETKADGTIYNCQGEFKATSKEIANIPAVHALVGQRVKHSTIKSVAATQGAVVSKDIIKKGFAVKMPTRSDIEHSANYVEPYLDELKRLNPGCEVKVERYPNTDPDADAKLHRFFVIPSYTKPLINDEYGFTVVGLDAAHMKDVVIKKRMPRAMLEKYYVTVISGRMPGNTQIIYAFMLSHSECSEDIEALFELLKESGVNLDKESIIIVSDRGKAIIKAVLDKMTKAYHHFCPLHIEGNLKAAGFGDALSLFWLARNATTEAEHNKYMTVIKNRKVIGERMYAYLKSITDNWQVHLVVSKGLMLYGFKSSNIVEGAMGWLKEDRRQSPYHFARGTMVRIATCLTEQAKEARRFKSALTEYAQKRYLEHERTLMAYSYQVDDCGGKAYQVRSNVENRATTSDYRVDLNTHTCTCSQWKQRGIPCIHAAAVAQHTHIPAEELYAVPFFHLSMLQKRRRDAFENCVKPFILPSTDEVEAKFVSGGYTATTYGIIENYPKLTTNKRFASSGEKAHAGNTNPRRTELRQCNLCYEMMKSTKNHSVRKCMTKIAELKKAGTYHGPLDAMDTLQT